jgi:hypothetical protein
MLDRIFELQVDREEEVEVEIAEALPGKDEELQTTRCEGGKFEND